MNPVLTFLTWLYIRHERALKMHVEEVLYQPDAGIGIEAQEGLSTLFWGLLLIVIIPVSILVTRRIIKVIRKRREKSLIEEMQLEAGKNERAGRFVSAGVIYEKLKDFEKAAGLYEKGGDFVRAALIYESLGRTEKVREMYEKAGDPEMAARASIVMGDYVDAARIYRQKGDRLKAAEALEMSGNRLAAVREYREAGDYVRAAMLLKEEEMYKEASEMFKISLTGEDIQSSNIEKYYTYSDLLEKAGEPDKAVAIFKNILAIDPHYRDVQEKLENINIQETPEVYEGQETEVYQQASSEYAKRETTLRSMIQSGGMEPRYCLRLWVQILKTLAQKHKQGIFFGNLAPETIFIDVENNVRVSENRVKDFAYAAPEIISGESPDQKSDIYSMGIMLVEMLTGNLDSIGIKKPGEIITDVPSWLDELTMRCIERDRVRRYQNLDEIFSSLIVLKKKTGD